MRKLGILGGCSWTSTETYYRGLNLLAQQKQAGHGSDLLLRSFDGGAINAMIVNGDWDAAGAVFADAAQDLERSGADALLIATNTMHKIADQITASVQIPLISIIDTMVEELRKRSLKRPLLLGTNTTMRQSWYYDRLEAAGLEPVATHPILGDTLDDVIFSELQRGEVSAHGQSTARAIIEEGIADGANAVILGCTELGLLIKQGEYPIRVLDSAEVHIAAAHRFQFAATQEALEAHG